MPQFSAILFDLDGTLIDTPKYWRDAYRIALKTQGHDFQDKDFQMLYPAGKPMGDWLTHLGMDLAYEGDLRSIRDAAYQEMLRMNVEWYPGAEICVRTVVESFPTGIVTGSHKSYIDAIEERIPIRSTVDVFFDTDDTQGKVNGLRKAAETLGVDPASCVYIGDQPFDVEAAQRTGMTSWIVRRPFAPEVFPWQPEKFFVELEEALQLLC
jgi:beta-phosphoglucomutase-like phosphatase (HAD superfamily)